LDMEFTIQIRDDLAENLRTRAEFLGKTLEQLSSECLEVPDTPPRSVAYAPMER